MTTREKIIAHSFNQDVFKDWPDGAKNDLKTLLGDLYDKYGAFGMIHHQNELLEGMKTIMRKHGMEED